MNTLIFQPTFSDFIQLTGIVVSLITSLIAIIISVKTLRQNSKMIEESTRPNIQIYPVYMDSVLYIIIKNFGSSEAIIDEVECNHEFTEAESFDNSSKDGFGNLCGALFSPGYSLKCPLVGYAVSKETFEFQVKYHSFTKEYSSKFSFNPYINSPFADTYPSAKTVEGHLGNIANSLHSIRKLNL